jgi:hypothetical protein
MALIANGNGKSTRHHSQRKRATVANPNAETRTRTQLLERNPTNKHTSVRKAHALAQAHRNTLAMPIERLVREQEQFGIGPIQTTAAASQAASEPEAFGFD